MPKAASNKAPTKTTTKSVPPKKKAALRKQKTRVVVKQVAEHTATGQSTIDKEVATLAGRAQSAPQETSANEAAARPHHEKQKVEPLAWRKATAARIKRILTRYPAEQKQSAVIPVLKLAQDDFGGWLSVDAMNLVADTLAMPYIRVYEVATFYTMFNLEPVGKHHVQVCTNCSCMIRGSADVVKAVKQECGVLASGQTSTDNMFTFTEVECLGACVDAPMMQIGNHYYTNLTADKTRDILQALRAGKPPAADTPADPLKEGY